MSSNDDNIAYLPPADHKSDLRMNELLKHAEELETDSHRLLYWENTHAYLEEKRNRLPPFYFDTWESGDQSVSDQLWEIEAIIKELRTILSLEEDHSVKWPVLDEGRLNSDWPPLVQFLAKAMEQGHNESRRQLRSRFAETCKSYPDAKSYCEGKGLSPEHMNLDSLTRLKDPARDFLRSLETNRQSSDG